MKLQMKISRNLIGVLMAVLAIAFGFSSCDDDTTTDNTSFALYYSSLTDISPTMNGTIASPTYKGAVPSNFAITGITYGDEQEAYSGESFVIDAETGAINIVNSDALNIGKYSISVSCTANGNTHHFDDAVVVNFMKPVPEGITVTPAELRIEYALVMSEDGQQELPTAQVTTEGEHISITGYQISNVKKDEKIIENVPDPLFEISNDGVISVKKGSKNIEIGTYVLSLKLNTAVAGSKSELGLFPDAVKINITSKPVSLVYEPAKDLLEEEIDDVRTSYESKVPSFVGSTEGLEFSIAAVSPAEAQDKFTIDPTTGKITVAEGHGFQKDQSYKVSVMAKNEFSPEGVLFENVFSLDIVAFISPIQNFDYAETSVKQALQFSIQKNPEFKGGGNLEFAFTPEDQKKYNGILTLNKETGEISAEKYNKLAIGTYDIHVMAANNKGTEQTIVKLNIVENENYFTYISYGNNINEDQTPGNIYDNQYRFKDKAILNGTQLAPRTDIKENVTVKWKFTKCHHDGDLSMDENTGTISANLSDKSWKKYQLAVVMVTATVGEESDKDAQISRTFPVFFNYQATEADIEYTPFVFRVNPMNGGRSALTVTTADKSKTFINYRNTFSYFNINGYDIETGKEFASGRVDKTDDKGSPFLRDVWGKCDKGFSGQDIYGSNYPVTYFDGKEVKKGLDDNLLYIDNSEGNEKFQIVVNANKWYSNGYADGIFVGKTTYVTDGNFAKVNDGKTLFPLAVWFDKDFE